MADPPVNWAAMSAAALAVAVAGAPAVVVEPCAEAGAVPAACPVTARFCVSRVSSAAAVVLPEVPLSVALPVAERPLCAGALPDVVADVADAGAMDDGIAAPAIAPDSAPASAFSSSVRAADTGSVAECFEVGSLGGSVPVAALPFAVEASAGVLPAAGVAASD